MKRLIFIFPLIKDYITFKQRNLKTHETSIKNKYLEAIMQKLFDMINFSHIIFNKHKIINIYTRRDVNEDELTFTKRK